MTVLDTHAGAGLYRLDSDYAATSGEARDGVLKLFAALRGPGCRPNRDRNRAQCRFQAKSGRSLRQIGKVSY